MKNQNQFNYDSEYDILYLCFDSNEPSMGSEDVDGVVLRHSIKTGRLVSITIFDFKKRSSQHNFDGISPYIDPEKLLNLELHTVRQRKPLEGQM